MGSQNRKWLNVCYLFYAVQLAMTIARDQFRAEVLNLRTFFCLETHVYLNPLNVPSQSGQKLVKQAAKKNQWSTLTSYVTTCSFNAFDPSNL